VPLYFNALSELTDKRVTSLEFLAHRIVWSVVFLAFLLTAWKRWHMVGTCMRTPTIRWTLVASTVLISLNWYVYIYGVVSEQVLQTSLGYFINPLVNVLLGMAFFGERLRRLQWLAVLLATAGVAGMTVVVGELPWIALSLAACFGLYGLLRKSVPVDGLVGLSVETFLLMPIAVAYLVFLASDAAMSLGAYGTVCDAMLLASGVVTALPLMCFAQATQRLRLSTMGFLQFLSPTLQFLCAVAILGEPLKTWQLQCFIAIWCGLALYCVDAVLTIRPRMDADS